MNEKWLKLKSMFTVLSKLDDDIFKYGNPQTEQELCNLAATLAKGARANAMQKRRLASRMMFIAFEGS